MLTFPLASVRDVIARGRADAEGNGGLRNPYYGLMPGKDEQPGLWPVGGHGAYLLSNGKLAGDEKRFVVYAEECNPATNDDWFEVKRRTFGGDDGVDFLDTRRLEAILAESPNATHLRIVFEADTMQLFLIGRD